MSSKQASRIVETPDEFLNRILSPDYVAELMDELGHEIRGGLFHPAMTVWLMIFQRLSNKGSLSEALASFRDGVGGALMERSKGSAEESSLSTGGFSQARTRLPEQAVNEIANTINEAIVGSHPEHLWKGRHGFLLDGTDFRVIAQGDLKREFPPARDAKNKSPWSIIRSVLATHVVTGVTLRASIGPMHGKNARGEVGLSKEVIPQLPDNSIVIADKGLGTFAVAFTAINNGHDVLLRLTEVRARQALGEGAFLKEDGDVACTWHPANGTLQAHAEIEKGDLLQGRIIRRTFQPAGHKAVTLFLFTSLLDLPADEIVSLYALRWNIETDFRSLKTTMKMELLDVKSASMA